MWTFFQEVSTHVYLKDTAKTLQQLIEMKKIKNPLLVEIIIEILNTVEIFLRQSQHKKYPHSS